MEDREGSATPTIEETPAEDVEMGAPDAGTGALVDIEPEETVRVTFLE